MTQCRRSIAASFDRCAKRPNGLLLGRVGNLLRSIHRRTPSRLIELGGSAGHRAGLSPRRPGPVGRNPLSGWNRACRRRLSNPTTALQRFNTETLPPRRACGTREALRIAANSTTDLAASGQDRPILLDDCTSAVPSIASIGIVISSVASRRARSRPRKHGSRTALARD
jgi:hypothetical protein